MESEWKYKHSTDEWYLKGHHFTMTVYEKEGGKSFLAAIWDPNTNDRWGVVHNDKVVDYRSFSTIESAQRWCEQQELAETEHNNNDV